MLLVMLTEPVSESAKMPVLPLPCGGDGAGAGDVISPSASASMPSELSPAVLTLPLVTSTVPLAE